MTYLLVFLGAGIGGSLRHFINVVAYRLLGSDFPHGTLIINVVGSLVMGLLAGYFALKSDPGQAWRLFLTTGIVGGFTTFSAFSLETARLIERGQSMSAGVYVVTSVAGSVAALFLGLMLTRQMA